eukprot:70159_1
MQSPFLQNGGAIALSASNPNDNIIIYQSNYGTIMTCSEIPSDYLWWTYVPPTPILEQRGLSPRVLSCEINKINEMAARLTRIPDSECSKFASIIGFILFVLGLVLLFRSMFEFDADHEIYMATFPTICYIIMVVIGLVVLITVSCEACSKKQWAIKSAKEKIRNYIECDLNEKYQRSNGIRWTIAESKMVCVTTRNHVSTTSNISYYHIMISCVAIVDNVALINVHPNGSEDESVVEGGDNKTEESDSVE